MLGLIGELNTTMDNVARTRQEMLEITGTAWSDDRLIRAVVGPRGQLVELDIDPRVYRTPNSKALSASILATVRAAVDDASAKTRAIMDRVLPKDRMDGVLGRTDFDVMADTHDADLPRAMREPREDGHGYLPQR
jgi:DNA-binding protein YbaB